MVLFTRRDAINRRLNKNKILSTFVLGILCLIMPVIIIITDPIHVYVNYKLRLGKGSTLYEMFQNEIPADYLSFYFFNITNAARFLSGADRKLKVDEVGPFVYKEYRIYNNMSFSADGKTMSMTPKIRTEFIPEMSIANPKDINLTVPNLPLLCSTYLLSEYPKLIQFAFNMIIKNHNSKAIINVNLDKYIWGYQDPIMTLAHQIAPGLAYFKTLGLLDRFYDYDSEYRMEIGATNEDKFSIKSLRKLTHLQMGDYDHIEESVELYEDTYEGCGYPPNLTPDVPIHVLRLGICQSFYLEFLTTKIMDYGGEALVYTLGNKTFTNNRLLNSKSMPDGLLDISRCFYNLPLAVSKAHFLDSDPKLWERIEGLKPDRNVHINRVTIDRKAAFTMNTEMSLQLNMALGDMDFNPESQKFTNTVIPIAHVSVRQLKFTEDTMNKFILLYTTLPIIMSCLQAVSYLTGLALVAYAIKLIYCNWISRKNTISYETNVERKSTGPSEMLLMSADICR